MRTLFHACLATVFLVGAAQAQNAAGAGTAATTAAGSEKSTTRSAPRSSQAPGAVGERDGTARDTTMPRSGSGSPDRH